MTMTCLHNGTCATRLFSAFVLFTRLGHGISSYVLESTISHISCFLNKKEKERSSIIYSSISIRFKKTFIVGSFYSFICIIDSDAE